MIESVVEKLLALRLRAFAQHIEQALQSAAQKNSSSLQVIDHLASLELELRRESRIQLCFKQSRLYDHPTLDQRLRPAGLACLP